MMTNLFSIFDPASSGGMSLNWSALGLSLLLLPMLKMLQQARWGAMVSLVSTTLCRELLALLPPKTKSSVVVFVALFLFVGLGNTLGLLPYVFTPTSHLVISLSLALPLWLGCFFQGWVVYPREALAHLVPLGTPAGLMPFMVVIEAVSSLIRPGTLAVRLAANMIAGHLLLTLMSSAITPQSGILGASICSAQSGLVILEMAVAIIQAYVFMTLSALYASEV